MSRKHDRHGQHVYGAVRQKERKRWVRRVRAGGVVCWRCGDPIHPLARWDLGHVDEDGLARGFPTRHPEHRSLQSRDRHAFEATAGCGGVAALDCVAGVVMRCMRPYSTPTRYGRMYISPVELRAFEQDAGATSRQTVRMETNALFTVERVSAGLKIL